MGSSASLVCSVVTNEQILFWPEVDDELSVGAGPLDLAALSGVAVALAADLSSSRWLELPVSRRWGAPAAFRGCRVGAGAGDRKWGRPRQPLAASGAADGVPPVLGPGPVASRPVRCAWFTPRGSGSLGRPARQSFTMVRARSNATLIAARQPARSCCAPPARPQPEKGWSAHTGAIKSPVVGRSARRDRTDRPPSSHQQMSGSGG
jgi:hypothetical protein